MGAADPTGTAPLLVTAERLLGVADDIAALAAELAGACPDSGPLPCPPGALGDLSARLYRQWQQALAARQAEAGAVAHRLGELAGGLRRSAETYRWADEDAADRLRHASGPGPVDRLRGVEGAGTDGSPR